MDSKCRARVPNNSFVVNTVIPQSNDKYAYALKRYHPIITWQLTSKAVSQTKSPSIIHSGFQSSPSCLCFRHRRRLTATSISVRFSPRPSPSWRKMRRKNDSKLKVHADKDASLHAGENKVGNPTTSGA